MDKRAMRRLLKDLESTAEQALQQDAAFFEALQALKWEIDRDPRVKSAVRDLRAAGQRVFSSFLPRIKVRIRTENGILALARPTEIPSGSAPDPVATLTQKLKNAASAVIVASPYCQELERVVNEAVTASDSFENIASQIEKIGYEVLISLDLSAYAQVQPSSVPVDRSERANRTSLSEEPVNIELSAQDRSFLKELKITADENLRY
jgi:hypothetical protein